MNSSPSPRPSVFFAKNLKRAGFAHGFATREGGVSEGPYASLNFGPGDPAANVARNVAAFAKVVGFAPEALRQVTQVHGARVVRASTLASASAREEADALVLEEVPGGARAIGIRVADCVPILVGSRRTGAIGAIHAGWRGVVAGVVPAALAALDEPGADLVAAIGPCIGPCCFEVDAEVGARIAEASGEPRALARTTGPKAMVDLRRAVRAQLATGGVTDVEDVAGCTKCDAVRFFSHRRDGEPSGRHLAVIALRARA